MLDFLLDLFSSEEDKIYRKMKKEIMHLPAVKFTTENELVRIKDDNGFVTFYAILKKGNHVLYMEKDFVSLTRKPDDLWPIMNTYKFGTLNRDVSCKKLWKTNLKDVTILKHKNYLADKG